MTSNRQWKLESEYKYKKGDQAKSVFFQKTYEIGIGIVIILIIFLLSGDYIVCVSNVCFRWPPVLIVMAVPLIYIYRLIFRRNESLGDRGRRESHKTAILVKTKSGSFEYRFRKDSYIVLMNSSIKCKVCKQKFKTESDLERYFMICTENDECINGLARVSGNKPADFRP